MSVYLQQEPKLLQTHMQELPSVQFRLQHGDFSKWHFHVQWNPSRNKKEISTELFLPGWWSLYVGLYWHTDKRSKGEAWKGTWWVGVRKRRGACLTLCPLLEVSLSFTQAQLPPPLPGTSWVCTACSKSTRHPGLSQVCWLYSLAPPCLLVEVSLESQ